MEKFNRERLIYFLLMSILAMIITYLVFSGDFTSKEKKSLEESTQIYNENIKSLQSIKVNDSLLNEQLNAIKEKEFLLIKQIENGQITAQEAKKKYDDLNKDLQNLNAMNATRIGELNSKLNMYRSLTYSKDSMINFLRYKLGLKPLNIDNTDYEQIKSERKKSQLLESDKRKLSQDLDILENEKIDIRARLEMYKFYTDSLSSELKKFPTPRVLIENFKVQPVMRDRIKIENPNGIPPNDFDYFKLTFNISKNSRCSYGDKVIEVIYCNEKGECPNEYRTKVKTNFIGQEIENLEAIIKSDKFKPGNHTFKLVDDNLKVGQITVPLKY